jgi:hypothetical protein
MCKGYQRTHKGGWALESCSNNVSKPPLPNFVGTKRDEFGDFYFYEIATAADGFGFNDNERMQRNYDKKISPRDPGYSSRAPSLRRYPLEKHQ